jgi:hypothetical protein
MRYLLPLLLLGCTAQNRQLEIVGEWLEMPNSLELCDDLNVDEDRVFEQANWFHHNVSKDYPVFTWDDVYASTCNEPVGSRVIRIQRATIGQVIDISAVAWASYGWEHDVIAEEDPHSSIINYNSVEYMDSCTISMGKLNTSWVIRHEFSHCWGWSHAINDEWSHLMSPKVGHDIEGLEYVPSEAWIQR